MRWRGRCVRTRVASGPSAIVYAVGWTQHTIGVQNVRAASIVQLLLGNIGRPGGGILALRGHANIQGSTDIPTLYNILPGYIPMPHPQRHPSLDKFVELNGPDTGAWGDLRPYIVSLLKAWWGDAATADNDYCFDYLPRINGDHSHYAMMLKALDGGVRGMFCVGQNPTVGSANSKLMRLALAKLDWLVVRDFHPVESAMFWQDSPEHETGEVRAQDIQTEVFFLPTAAHTEKDGNFTNTQRLLQWHHKAVEPPGEARSDLHWIYHLGRTVRDKLAGSTDPKDRPILDLTWDYPLVGAPASPTPRACCRRSPAVTTTDRSCPATTTSSPTGPPAAAPGSTAASTPTASTSRRARSPAPSRTGSPTSGAGRGPRTCGSSTTGRPPIPRASRGLSASATCGGTPRRASGRVWGHTGLSRDEGSRLQTGPRR